MSLNVVIVMLLTYFVINIFTNNLSLYYIFCEEQELHADRILIIKYQEVKICE